MTEISEEDMCAAHILLTKCIGLRIYDKLYKKLGSAVNIWHADPEILHKYIGREKTLNFLDFKSSKKSDSEISELSNNSVQLINPRSSRWESFFAFIADKPIILFAKGDVSLLSNNNIISVAIIGTRKPSEYGKKHTWNFSAALSQNRFCIISGMALGIDSIAHKAALANNGKTIAILGTAIDKPYPSIHRTLYNKILDQGGLILSEFPSGASVHPSNFIRRNRLISGLSKGLLIIEGTNHSGTLVTAKYALDQGIDIFALPGKVDSPNSYSPNHQIQNGAKLVTSPQDILDEFEITKSSQIKKSLENLPPHHQKIFQSLKNPQSSQDLLKNTSYSLQKLLTILTTLEVHRCIKLGIDGKYYATIDI